VPQRKKRLQERGENAQREPKNKQDWEEKGIWSLFPGWGCHKPSGALQEKAGKRGVKHGWMEKAIAFSDPAFALAFKKSANIQNASSQRPRNWERGGKKLLLEFGN